MSEEEILDEIRFCLCGEYITSVHEQAIKGLLDLYNKEKEENQLMKAEFNRLEDLEDNTEQLKGLLEDEREHNKKLQKELDLSNDCNIAMDYTIKHSINKDIIKEKIEELNKIHKERDFTNREAFYLECYEKLLEG